MTRKIIIAIDGHSSTGKSTLAKMLSKHLMYKHINTGSMYRALTLHALRNSWIDDSRELKINKHKIIESIDDLNLDFEFDEHNSCRMCINSEDVDDLLKDPLVSQYVSVISAYPLVRKKIVKIQQELGQMKGVVMEGRDIGSVVFPGAELKLFITASLKIRAKRRHQELIKLGIQASLKDVLHNLKMRDSSDSNRKNSPLICVKDAVLIDNTLLNIDMQFNMVVDLLKNKINLL